MSTREKRIDTDELNQPRSEEIRGVKVKVYFGFDDMPIAVQSAFDKLKNVLRVSFKYDSSNERTFWKPYDDDTRLAIGDKSGRLYELVVSNVQPGSVTLQVENALRAISQKSNSLGLTRPENYIAAKGAFRQVSSDIQELIQSASP